MIAPLAAHAERAYVPRPLLGDPTLYATLGIGASSDEEIRRAYKRKKEIYAEGGLAVSSPGRRAAQERASAPRRSVRHALDLSVAAPTSSTFPTPIRRPR
ncbi:MAG: hypothetical protein U0235_16975 [Polyangiaceae bacterium]